MIESIDVRAASFPTEYSFIPEHTAALAHL